MILPALGYLNLASDYLALGSGVVRRRRLEGALYAFLLYLFVATLTESITIVLAHLSIVNWWILHIFTLLAYGIVLWVLSCWQTGAIRILFRIIILIGVVLWALSKFTIENLGTADLYSQTISSSLLLVASGITLLVLKPRMDVSMIDDARFWIVSGLLLYTAGNLTSTLLLEKIVALNFSETMIVYQMHWALNICVNVIFAMGYLRLRR